MDGNTAAAHIAYAFTDVAAIYPITPLFRHVGNSGRMVCLWEEKSLRPDREDCGTAVGSRRSRNSPRLSDRRCSDDHLYFIAGSSSDDSK